MLKMMQTSWEYFVDTNNDEVYIVVVGVNAVNLFNDVYITKKYTLSLLLH